MNDLQRIGTTDAGNALLMYPLNGVLWYFERLDYESIRLHTVDTLKDVETEYDEFTTFEELPNPVRRAVFVSQYDMKDTKATLSGAMG